MNVNLNLNLNELLSLTGNETFVSLKARYAGVCGIKEDTDLFMLYAVAGSESAGLFERHASHVFTKKGFKHVTSFSKISFYNEDAKNYLKLNADKWDEFVVIQSLEGPIVQIFYYNDKWYIATETTLDGSDTYGTISKSVREYFIDTEKCDISANTKFNKSFCYHFILLHNKLKHIVQYSNLGPNFKEIAIFNITKNQLSPEEPDAIDLDLNQFQFLKPIVYHFSCFKELDATLEKISYDNAVYKRISTEGFLIKHNVNGNLLKLQTEIYTQISKLKPLRQNSYQVFLELYQVDKLNDILPYVSKYSNEIIHRINMSMRTVSREILNIYHTTRKKKNGDLYDALTDQYKKTLYGIHGLYIKGRKKDFVNGKEIEGKDTRSITVHDIYYYVKNLTPEQLRQLYFDRMELMKNAMIIPYLNLNCIYTLTQTRLMST
ncbi:MAG: RNA ligase [Hyperionvirus sp.]|uniref:RNA ligase n=1 Tax=Hyperionvirus sp. TaxID=2487770 RepID=A0A3G5AF43_9VIRU|nr:MAG: RNA ligase [Hyperionvirus sp.]